MLVEHKENHAQMDARVSQLEQETTDHHRALLKIQVHEIWLVPTVIGLAAVLGGLLFWFGTKIMRQKKDKDDKDKADKNSRKHARAWRVAPEVFEGYGTPYSNDGDGDYISH